MFRLILSTMFLAGVLSLNAQVPTPGASSPYAGLIHQIEPLVQVGGFLQEQSSPYSGTTTTLLAPTMSMPLTPPGVFMLQNALEPARSFRVEPRSYGEYSIGNNSNPLENYTIRIQPGNGFTIQDNLSVTGRSYAVNEQPWGGFNVYNRMNPMESFTVPSNPLGNFGARSYSAFDGFQPSSDPFQRNVFSETLGTQPFGGYGFQGNFGAPSPTADPWSSSSGMSWPSGFQQPFGLP